MRSDATKAFCYRKGATAFAATMIAAIVTAGCGGAQSPPAVRLVLTAPTEGAVVNISEIKVFGTVDPSNAAVNVAGDPVHVSHGAFARWMTLHAGLSHIKIVATAAGYTPADMNIPVSSSPSAPPTQTAATSAEPSASGIVNPTPSPAGSRYTPGVQANLLHSCEAAASDTPAAVTSCECVLSYLEARVSQSAIEAWERAFLKGEATLPQWLKDADLACKTT